MIGTLKPNSAEGAVMAEMVERLESPDVILRQSTRKKFVAMGRAAIVPLIVALQRGRRDGCWEAAKALGEIGDPMAAPALVEAMMNADDDVSWVAGESLIALGDAALVPVLMGLLKYARFHRFRIGAHRILSCLKSAHPNQGIQPVIRALDDPHPDLAAPVAAERALLDFIPQIATNSGPDSLTPAV